MLEIASDEDIATLESKVVEAAVAWLKARTTTMTDGTWAAIYDDCESKTDALYQSVKALITAREKE